jgi:pimeloyl-ACP methyl ester carboxylesterase
VDQRIRFCSGFDGARIAYAQSGSGPPLVMSATWLGHLEQDWRSLAWRPWLEHFSREHTLLRYDLRGTGLSDRSFANASLDTWVRDFATVVDAAGPGRFPLLGVCQGGPIAVEYAARHPDRVSHLILTGVLAVGRMARDPPALIEQTGLELKAIELGWGNDNPAFRQFITSLLIPDSTLDQARSLNELMRLASSPQTAIRRLQPYHHVDLREIAASIRCPTLIFHSRSDARIPFEQGRALAALIPGARFVPLESSNHWIVNTEPAWSEFAGTLDDFLPRLPQADDAVATALLDALTTRELQVIELLAAGLDNPTIGRRLGISEKTVRNHVSTIFSKVGANSRPQAIVWAREAGFGRKPQAGV